MKFKAIMLAAALAAAGTPTLAAAEGRSPPLLGQASLGQSLGLGLGASLGLSLQDRNGPGRRRDQGEARDRVRQGDILPLPRVLGEVRRRAPGRLLDAGLEDAGGRPAYRVRWAAADGRRIDYLVDARTGAVIRADGE